MTESEWLTATDPTAMLEFLQGKASDRKLRLFACGVSRQFAPLVRTDVFLLGIEAAEGFVDGQRTKAAMTRCRRAMKERMVELVGGYPQSDEWKALFLTSLAIGEKEYRGFSASLFNMLQSRGGYPLKRVINSAGLIVSDIFGNPFRPVTLDPRWQSETVVALATGIYAERAFDRMPILADALEEAGCDHTDILAHCRGDGPHVRGCWVVDLILGKE